MIRWRAGFAVKQERGHGSFFFTGATAGMRGNAGHAAHAAGMFARRGFAQSLPHEFWCVLGSIMLLSRKSQPALAANNARLTVTSLCTFGFHGQA